MLLGFTLLTGHRCFHIPASMSRRAPKLSFSPDNVFMIFSAMSFSHCITSNVCQTRRSCNVTMTSHMTRFGLSPYHCILSPIKFYVQKTSMCTVVGYTYFPVQKVKETWSPLYSMFVYRIRCLLSCAVLSCPPFPLICISQVLSATHPSWWRSHVNFFIKIGL